MGTGYVRQAAADIITGAVIEAAPLNLELNALRDAFHETSGHSHDGTTGEGPKIDLTTSAAGVLPIARGGIAAIHKINGTAAPTANDDSDDGYGPGSMWVDTTNDRIYFCVDATVAAAVWVYAGNSSGWQPLDATLTALAGVTTAADKLIYATGSDTFTTTDFSAFGRTLVDDADASAARTTLGLVIGTNVQAYDADLAAIAGLTSATDKGIQFTGAGTAATYDLTSFAKTLLDDASASAARTTLGLVIGTDVQAYDSELAAIAGLTSAADRVPYFTGAGTAALATFTSAGRALVDDATASDQLTTLGFSTYGKTLIDDADAATARTTLGLGSLSTASTINGGNWSGTDLALADGGTGASLTDPNADRILFWDDSAGAVTWLVPGNGLQISTTDLRVLECLEYAISDELTALTTGTAKLTVRVPYAFTITAVRASLSTVSSSGNPAFDINENGVSIFSTTLTIDANEKTSTTATTAAVISNTSLADDAELTFDIDTAGTGAKGAKIKIYGYRT